MLHLLLLRNICSFTFFPFSVRTYPTEKSIHTLRTDKSNSESIKGQTPTLLVKQQTKSKNEFYFSIYIKIYIMFTCANFRIPKILLYVGDARSTRWHNPAFTYTWKWWKTTRNAEKERAKKSQQYNVWQSETKKLTKQTQWQSITIFSIITYILFFISEICTRGHEQNYFLPHITPYRTQPTAYAIVVHCSVEMFVVCSGSRLPHDVKTQSQKEERRTVYHTKYYQIVYVHDAPSLKTNKYTRNYCWSSSRE